MENKLSLTKESIRYLEELELNAEKLKIKISKINKAKIIDCGIEVEGSITAGLLFTKLSLGGLAKVNIDFSNNEPFFALRVETSHPVLATLGCQAASWNIKKGEFFGMACGPGRALAQKPSKSYKLLDYKDENDIAILCIESDRLPNDEVIEYLAEKCKVEKQNLRLIMIKTNCLVEYIQMAARAVELGIFRLVEQLGYSKEKVLHAVGYGIVPPISIDADKSNNRVNNGLIYGTKLYLIINSNPEDDLDTLIQQIPSKFSKNYGRTYLEAFNEAGLDFANFDLSLIAPTEVIINDVRTGKIYHEGKIETDYLLK